jgi:hypothetical protein
MYSCKSHSPTTAPNHDKCDKVESRKYVTPQSPVRQFECDYGKLCAIALHASAAAEWTN